MIDTTVFQVTCNMIDHRNDHNTIKQKIILSYWVYLKLNLTIIKNIKYWICYKDLINKGGDRCDDDDDDADDKWKGMEYFKLGRSYTVYRYPLYLMMVDLLFLVIYHLVNEWQFLW